MVLPAPAGPAKATTAAVLEPAIAGDLHGARDGREREAARRGEIEVGGNLARQRAGEILRDAELRELLEHRGLHRRAARHVVPRERRELRFEHAAHVFHFVGEFAVLLGGLRGLRRGGGGRSGSGERPDAALRHQRLGQLRGSATRAACARLVSFCVDVARRRAARRTSRATSTSIAATTSTWSPMRAGGQDDRLGAHGLAHLRERAAHVLGDVSLNSHSLLPSSISHRPRSPCGPCGCRALRSRRARAVPAR